MVHALRISGVLLLLAGLLLGVLAAFPSIAPEGSWGEGASTGWRWGEALLALAIMVAGALLFRMGVKRGHQSPDTFLTRDEERSVLKAIAEFENRTSGEIRVHLARSAGADVLASARRVFEKLGMTGTAERNGVLFFVAVARRRFAVVGDSGIDAVVPDGFWDDVIAHVRERFRSGDYAGGLVEGIRMAGEALSEHFPVAEDDINELPDEISRE